MANKQALNIVKMKKMKADGERLSMLTAYDYPSALLAEEAGIDLILVGDSWEMWYLDMIQLYRLRLTIWSTTLVR